MMMEVAVKTSLKKATKIKRRANARNKLLKTIPPRPTLLGSK